MLRLVFAWFTLLDRRLVESAPRYFPDIGKSLAYIVLRRQALGRGVAASALTKMLEYRLEAYPPGKIKSGQGAWRRISSA
jgi:hypothetical protein